ncbi:MAG: iron-containing alcohol dehydrogenase [Campylobacteraceae bacterium]
MKPFTYYNPTRLIYGDRQKEIGKILKNAGHKRVLLIYGQNSIKKSGLYDEITKVLKDENIEVVEHAGVSSNPTIAHARVGVEKAKNATAVLAVGGGSVVDEAKTIAAASLTKCDPWELFMGKKVTFALDLFVILTISATGSEMNEGAVITNEETKEKLSFKSPLVFPKVSIINPAFMKTVPDNYLAYSAVDIIAHAIEGYFTSEDSPAIQKRFVENIVKTVIESTNAVIKNRDDLDARYEFALASTWALNGLTSLGLGRYNFPNHMIEHSLSAIYNVAHGAGLAVIIPAWLKWLDKRDSTRIERFSREIFGKETSQEGIKALENWFSKIGAPISLNELIIPASDTEEIAKNAFNTSVKWGMSEVYGLNTIKEILLNALKD